MSHDDEVALLAIKISAMKKKIQELELRNKTLLVTNAKLLQDLEQADVEMEKELAEKAKMRLERIPSVITSLRASDIFMLEDYWLLPGNHFAPNSSRCVPDDSRARYIHCKKMAKQYDYDTKANFREFVTIEDVRAYARRILFVVHRKGFFLLHQP